MTYDVTTFKPQGGDLALANSDYNIFLSQFKRAASVVLSAKDCIEPYLDVKDDQAVKNVMGFLLWSRTFSQEQWKKGVPLNKAAIHAACGAPHHLGYAAFRACLIKLKSGNRKKGEPDTWTLSLPHTKGLAIFLARNAAHVAARAAFEIEQTEKRIKMESDLEAALSMSPEEARYRRDHEISEKRRLAALEVPLSVRAKDYLEAFACPKDLDPS